MNPIKAINLKEKIAKEIEEEEYKKKMRKSLTQQIEFSEEEWPVLERAYNLGYTHGRIV